MFDPMVLCHISSPLAKAVGIAVPDVVVRPLTALIFAVEFSVVVVGLVILVLVLTLKEI